MRKSTVLIGEQKWEDRPEVIRGEVPEPVAQFAMKLMGNLSIVAAVPDGQDGAGRQKMRMLNPEEVVNRACQIAEASWTAFQRLGWLVPVPVPPPALPSSEQ